jgi:hypothetical protein
MMVKHSPEHLTTSFRFRLPRRPLAHTDDLAGDGSFTAGAFATLLR